MTRFYFCLFLILELKKKSVYSVKSMNVNQQTGHSNNMAILICRKFWKKDLQGVINLKIKFNQQQTNLKNKIIDDQRC